MNNTFLELNKELKELTGLYQLQIKTLSKDDITIRADCIRPPIGIEETEEFLAKSLLTLIRDGWTAIPF